MSQVFHGTIFSIPSKLKFDPEVEARKAQLRKEKDELQLQVGENTFKGNPGIPYVNPNSPIFRAIEKALGN